LKRPGHTAPQRYLNRQTSVDMSHPNKAATGKTAQVTQSTSNKQTDNIQRRARGHEVSKIHRGISRRTGGHNGLNL
jgi:hypothetical protein